MQNVRRSERGGLYHKKTTADSAGVWPSSWRGQILIFFILSTRNGSAAKFKIEKGKVEHIKASLMKNADVSLSVTCIFCQFGVKCKNKTLTSEKNFISKNKDDICSEC